MQQYHKTIQKMINFDDVKQNLISKTKYQFLINKRGSTGLKHLNDSKAFIDMDDIYKKIGEDNPNKKRKILIVFDDIIADILSHKKLNAIVKKY